MDSAAPQERCDRHRKTSLSGADVGGIIGGCRSRAIELELTERQLDPDDIILRSAARSRWRSERAPRRRARRCCSRRHADAKPSSIGLPGGSEPGAVIAAQVSGTGRSRWMRGEPREASPHMNSGVSVCCLSGRMRQRRTARRSCGRCRSTRRCALAPQRYNGRVGRAGPRTR